MSGSTEGVEWMEYLKNGERMFVVNVCFLLLLLMLFCPFFLFLRFVVTRGFCKNESKSLAIFWEMSLLNEA